MIPSVNKVTTNKCKDASNGVNHALQNGQEHRGRASGFHWLSEFLDFMSIGSGTLDLIQEITVIECPIVIIIIPPAIIIRFGEIILSDRATIL